MTIEHVGAGWRLLGGEALALLQELPAASVDAVVTDPPYSSGGMMRGDRTQDTKIKYVKSSSVSGQALPDFGGDTRDQRAYAYWCALWLSEALRVTKPGGICVLFTDWRQLPTTTDALQAGGFVWRGIVPWNKPDGRRTYGRPANTCEYAVWGTAGGRGNDDEYETLPGFIQCNTTRRRVHIAQKPVEVMRVLVRVAPAGGVVLDPFAGAATTGVAALAEGRQFLGFERDPEHLTNGAARLRQAAAEALPAADQGDLFAEMPGSAA